MKAHFPMDGASAQRSPDYLYTLRGEPAYGFHAGRLTDGRQTLVTPDGIVYFSTSGDLLCADEHPFAGGLLECPIRVKRFFLAQPRVGIADLTDTCREYIQGIGTWNEEELRDFPEMIREWLESGKCVFCCGTSDFYMNSDGWVETT